MTDGITHGTYIGLNTDLAGKTALLMTCNMGWLAQFDDRSTGFAYGWYAFGRGDFEVDREELN